MSENKKYYWLKLNENFFEDDTITWIEEQDNGKDYIIFYLKLALKSLTDNGYLIRYVGEKLIPYDVKALAKLTNTDTDTVRVAMNLFLEVGIISQLDSGEIYLNQIDEMIGSETESAKRVRKHRAKQKVLQSNEKTLQGNSDVIKGNTDIERRDREKREEKEQQIEKEPADSLLDPHLFYQQNINPYQATAIIQDIEDWKKDLSPELVVEALRRAVESGKPSYTYAKGIMRKWVQKGIKTLQQVEEDDKRWNQQNGRNNEIPVLGEKTEEEKELDRRSRERLDAMEKPSQEFIDSLF